MDVILTLDEDLIEKVRKIATERNITLEGMVRDLLAQIASGEAPASEYLGGMQRGGRATPLRLSLYDGIITTGAERGGCSSVSSEDGDDGQGYFGVLAKPFNITQR